MKAVSLLSLGLAVLAGLAGAQEVIIDNLDPQFTSQLAPGGDPGVVVLLYHGLDSSFGYDPADFQAQMQHLADNGYATWTMDQLLGWIQTGTPELTSPTVVLTFDDNYFTVYSVAYPTLQSHGFVGINYAHTDYVGVPPPGNDHSDWIEINEMETAGVMLTESHSRTHPNLTSLGDSALTDQLAGSRSAIESNIPGKTCRHLAYPYGAYDSRVISFAQTEGFETAVTTVPGVVTRSTPPMEINRYGVNPDTPMSTFASTVANATGGGIEWISSTSEPEHWGSDYQYAPAGTAGAVATWVFGPSQSGEWAIDVWYTDHSNRATNAPYAVDHDDGTAIHRVDQTLGGGTWNTLGSHIFRQGNYYSIRLTAADADGYVIADAIRFRRVSDVPVGLVILGAE